MPTLSTSPSLPFPRISTDLQCCIKHRIPALLQTSSGQGEVQEVHLGQHLESEISFPPGHKLRALDILLNELSCWRGLLKKNLLWFACCLLHLGKHWGGNKNPQNLIFNKKNLGGGHALGCVAKFMCTDRGLVSTGFTPAALVEMFLACSISLQALYHPFVPGKPSPCSTETCHPTHCWGPQSLCAGCFIS